MLYFIIFVEFQKMNYLESKLLYLHLDNFVKRIVKIIRDTFIMINFFKEKIVDPL